MQEDVPGLYANIHHFTPEAWSIRGFWYVGEILELMPVDAVGLLLSLLRLLEQNSTGLAAQTTGLCCLPVLEAGRLKVQCWQGLFLLGTVGPSPIHAVPPASPGFPAGFGIF